MLDMYDLCSEDLKKKQFPAREKFKEEEDRRVDRVAKVRYDSPNVLDILFAAKIYS